MTKEEMVQKFQCPGCTCGMFGTCGKFKLEEGLVLGRDLELVGWYGFRCSGHSVGTFMMGIGRILLGLPIGFNRLGNNEHTKIRMFRKEDAKPEYDLYNVPVWAKVEDGFLFVRCYSPRNNWTAIDIIEGGDLSLVPNAIDVTNVEMD